jgi:hypothetical protein
VNDPVPEPKGFVKVIVLLEIEQPADVLKPPLTLDIVQVPEGSVIEEGY